MSLIANVRNPWRDILVREKASFRGVYFQVESGGRSSGQRTVVHEYPKRDTPYAESMGRHALRFNLTGYLVYRPRKINESNPLLYDYVRQRKLLYEALEADGAGKLVHPVFAPGGMPAMCERYTMTEGRDRGGFTQFEMAFVEAGEAVKATGKASNTSSSVIKTATAAEQAGLVNLGLAAIALVLKNVT